MGNKMTKRKKTRSTNNCAQYTTKKTNNWATRTLL